MTARLVTFTVTVTGPAGQTTTRTFRVLTTLLDHDDHPAAQVAACYPTRPQRPLHHQAHQIKSTWNDLTPNSLGQCTAAWPITSMSGVQIPPRHQPDQGVHPWGWTP